jgi:hypothetical protein
MKQKAAYIINELDTYFIYEDPALYRQEESVHQQINWYIHSYEYRNTNHIVHCSVVHLQSHAAYAFRFERVLTMAYDTQNYWDFELFPSSGIPVNRKHDVSEN